jgi:hypothetical protein
MNRRELFRTTLLTAAGAAGVATHAGAVEFPADLDASKQLARADWKPEFLDPHQNDTLAALSELIIPETDTPGAKTALCNRFIDRLLKVESRETQQAFLNSLAFFDGESIRRHGKAFVYLAPELQTELLELVAYPHTLESWGDVEDASSGHNHFSTIKDWVSRSFYSSEAGMKALGWNGAFPHGEPSACGAPTATHEHSG